MSIYINTKVWSGLPNTHSSTLYYISDVEDTDYWSHLCPNSIYAIFNLVFPPLCQRQGQLLEYIYIYIYTEGEREIWTNGYIKSLLGGCMISSGELVSSNYFMIFINQLLPNYWGTLIIYMVMWKCINFGGRQLLSLASNLDTKA